jgi:hypothetical protein
MARSAMVEGVLEVVGIAVLIWPRERRSPAKFRRRKAQSRRDRGIGELEGEGECDGVLKSSRGRRYL